MAHSLSAKKRIRQNLKNRLRNRRRAAGLKSVMKDFVSAVQTGKVDQAEKDLPKLYKAIDQIAAKGTIHKHAAARYKSRLTARLAHAKKAGSKAA